MNNGPLTKKTQHLVSLFLCRPDDDAERALILGGRLSSSLSLSLTHARTMCGPTGELLKPPASV